MMAAAERCCPELENGNELSGAATPLKLTEDEREPLERWARPPTAAPYRVEPFELSKDPTRRRSYVLTRKRRSNRSCRCGPAASSGARTTTRGMATTLFATLNT